MQWGNYLLTSSRLIPGTILGTIITPLYKWQNWSLKKLTICLTSLRYYIEGTRIGTFIWLQRQCSQPLFLLRQAIWFSTLLITIYPHIKSRYHKGRSVLFTTMSSAPRTVLEYKRHSAINKDSSKIALFKTLIFQNIECFWKLGYIIGRQEYIHQLPPC